MEIPDHAHSDWTECQPGTLSQLSQELQARSRSQQLQRRSILIASIALVAIGSFSMLHEMTEGRTAALACDDVRRLAQQFVNGSLNTQQQDAVTEHLAGCPRCQAVVDRLSREQENAAEKNSPDRRREPLIEVAGL